MKKNNKCKILSTLLAAPCCFWRKRDAIKNNLEGGGGPNVPPNQMLLPIPCCFYMFYVVEEGFYAKKNTIWKVAPAEATQRFRDRDRDHFTSNCQERSLTWR